MILEDEKQKTSAWSVEHLFGLDEPEIKVPEIKPVLTSGAKDNLQKTFELFHKQNPHVLDTVIRIASELKHKRGFKRCGMKMLFERLRWLYALQTQGDDYKLNNNYTAYYARTVMALRKDLEGFFAVRKTNMSFDPDWDALDIDPKDPKWQTL